MSRTCRAVFLHVVIAAAGEPYVGFDLRDFYHREGRLLGVDTLKLTLAESAAILRQLAAGFDSGAFRPPAVETCPLAESPGAYARLHAGDVKRKLVLVPGGSGLPPALLDMRAAEH
jgi:NADPH:quinone reductase-like Zn-dependent oxidoreductase